MEYFEPPKGNPYVSFGTTTDRPTFPTQIANDRFGNEMNPIKGEKNVGPGQYNNHELTTFTNLKKTISTKGYILGARTAERHFSPIPTDAPSPTRYEPLNKIVYSNNKSFKPFSTGAGRFKSDPDEITPGPGAYEHDVERNRSVQMLHSFGGRASIIPVVNIRCTINSDDQCENCNEKPNGDYYTYKNHNLCNKCYDYNWKWQEKFNRPYLSSFRKVRSCSFMHDHQGTNAAIQKLSEKDLRKLKHKEAYLSLYWS